jgi:hypothetical protein
MMSASGTERTSESRHRISASGVMVLQKSKVAGQRFFRENTKWEAIDD